MSWLYGISITQCDIGATKGVQFIEVTSFHVVLIRECIATKATQTEHVIFMYIHVHEHTYCTCTCIHDSLHSAPCIYYCVHVISLCSNVCMWQGYMWRWIALSGQAMSRHNITTKWKWMFMHGTAYNTMINPRNPGIRLNLRQRASFSLFSVFSLKFSVYFPLHVIRVHFKSACTFTIRVWWLTFQ